jgi:hypothetical protein
MTVSRAVLLGVMVVVPPFTGGQERHPPEVFGIEQRENGKRDPKVISIEESIKLSVGQIGHVLHELGRREGLLVDHEEMTHMGKEKTILRTMGISFRVRVLMMDPMLGNPKERRALGGERSDDCENIFEPTRDSESAMGEHSMIGQRHSDRTDGEEQAKANGQCRPGKEGESRKRSDVNKNDPEDRFVVEFFLGHIPQAYFNFAADVRSMHRPKSASARWRFFYVRFV